MERKTIKEIASETGRTKAHVHNVRKGLGAALEPYTEIKGNRVFIIGEGIEILKRAVLERKQENVNENANENVNENDNANKNGNGLHRPFTKREDHFSVLVRELEAKNRQIEELQEANRRQQETILKQQEAIQRTSEENRKLTDKMLTLIDQGQRLQLVTMRGTDAEKGVVESQKASVAVSEDQTGISPETNEKGQETPVKRSWWKRLFG